MGIIKEGTREAYRSEKLFNEINTNYWQKDGNIHLGKYYTSAYEFEALCAGQTIQEQLENKIGGCYMEINKKNFIERANESQKYYSDSEKEKYTPDEKKYYDELSETIKQKFNTNQTASEIIKNLRKYLFG